MGVALFALRLTEICGMLNFMHIMDTNHWAVCLQAFETGACVPVDVQL